MTRMLALLLVLLGTFSGMLDAAPPATDEWIAALEGGWAGENNATPMGSMPFAALFEWEDDGSLHAHSAMNRETWIDLRFRKDGHGRWLLDESAGMEGLGVQRYTLEPVVTHGEARRWVWPEDPEFLSVDVALADRRMNLNVKLRGETHARFALDRLPADAIPALKREMAASAERSPAEISIHDVLDGSSTPRPILEARAAVAAAPSSAQAHLDLGKTIGELLQKDPVNVGPRYAGEMLQALQTAVELDPAMPEAYHWLAGYYLNAPPIAGGSVNRAEQVARRLVEVDPVGGSALLAEIKQAKRDQAQPN